MMDTIIFLKSGGCKDAEDDYNKLVDEMQKDEIKKALEDQIEALNKLCDTFADI